MSQVHGDDFALPFALAEYGECSRSDSIFYYDAASPSRDTVLLVHGNGDDADTWRHVLSALAESRRVVALDLPGFARSRFASGLGFPALVEALAGFIKRLDLHNIHLVGSSLGAAVISQYALKAADRVRSLSLIGGTPPGFLQRSPNHLSKFAELLVPGVGERYYDGLRELGEEAAYASLQPYYFQLQALPKSDQAFLRARVWSRVWSNTQRRAFFAALRSLVAAPALELTHLEFPVLLLWGEHDQIVSLEQGKALAQAIPHSQLAVIAEAGHLPQQEQPAAVVAHLQSFFSGVFYEPQSSFTKQPSPLI